MARQKPTKVQLEHRKLEAETLRAEIMLERARRDEAEAKADADAPFVYTFYDGVSADSVKDCMAEMEAYVRRNPKTALTIRLNSPGGLVIDGLALYDFILDLRKRGHHVTVVALGEAASMGGILLQAGDKRVIGKNAFLLIHEVSSGDEGKTTHMQDSVEFSKRLETKLLGILAKRSKLTVRQIRSRWERKDWWLDAEEAVELGFADEIL